MGTACSSPQLEAVVVQRRCRMATPRRNSGGIVVAQIQLDGVRTPKSLCARGRNHGRRARRSSWPRGGVAASARGGGDAAERQLHSGAGAASAPSSRTRWQLGFEGRWGGLGFQEGAARCLRRRGPRGTSACGPGDVAQRCGAVISAGTKGLRGGVRLSARETRQLRARGVRGAGR